MTSAAGSITRGTKETIELQKKSCFCIQEGWTLRTRMCTREDCGLMSLKQLDQ